MYTHTTYSNKHTVTNMVLQEHRQDYKFQYTRQSLARALQRLNHILESKRHSDQSTLSRDSHKLARRERGLESILEHELES